MGERCGMCQLWRSDMNEVLADRDDLRAKVAELEGEAKTEGDAWVAALATARAERDEARAQRDAAGQAPGLEDVQRAHGKLTLAHHRVCTELNTTRAQRDDLLAEVERVQSGAVLLADHWRDSGTGAEQCGEELMELAWAGAWNDPQPSREGEG